VRGANPGHGSNSTGGDRGNIGCRRCPKATRPYRAATTRRHGWPSSWINRPARPNRRTRRVKRGAPGVLWKLDSCSGNGRPLRELHSTVRRPSPRWTPENLVWLLRIRRYPVGCIARTRNVRTFSQRSPSGPDLPVPGDIQNGLRGLLGLSRRCPSRGSWNVLGNSDLYRSGSGWNGGATFHFGK
jgi:hypothetical protein